MALAIRQLVRRSSTVASIDSWILMDFNGCYGIGTEFHGETENSMSPVP